MTDNIVERLRAVSGPADLYLDHTNECRRLCGEAADEIKRLLGRLDKIAKHPDATKLIRQYAAGDL